MKFSEYAEAGIVDYWIVDLEAGQLTSYQLGADGTYTRTGEHAGKATIAACGIEFAVDMTRLR